jgi:hypothetical protein
MSRASRRDRRTIELLSLATVVALILGLAAMTILVYARMAVELARRTRESIVNRVMTVETQIGAVYSLAADEAMNVMSLMESGGPYDVRAIAGQLGTIQSGLVGCSSAWIVSEGRPPIYAQGSSRAIVESRTWWKPYLEQGPSWAQPGGGSFASLGIRKNIGYFAPAFRGSTGIGTILPLVVVRYSGTKRQATAFFEIDMTVILDGQLNSPAGLGGKGSHPMEISFYDQSGRFLESTRNLPLVRERPFGAEQSRPPALAEDGPVTDYLFPGDRSIEASFRDERMGLTCVGRTPARIVMQEVREVAAFVFMVAAVALGLVLVLGIFLLQAYRRGRSFEKEQLLARFEALQAKVNPHFLFNTLDSMIGVAEDRDFDTLMRMLRALSSMLHMTVRRTADIVKLGEELEYVSGYLAIQEVRYRDRFTARLDVDEAVLSTPICRFGLQPIVENCFTHGVHEGRLGMTISLRARLVGEDVWIEVEDDGPGCDDRTRRALEESFRTGENRLGREGGLFNLHNRIRMSFGDGYGLELPENEYGFIVRLRVPASDSPRHRAKRPSALGQGKATPRPDRKEEV